MRKTLSFVMSVLATVFVISCDKENNNGNGGGGDYVFALDESTPLILEFDWRADTIIVKYSITNPTATGMVVPATSVSWLTFNTQLSYGEIYIYATENYDYDDRYAQVSFIYENTEYTLDVVQASREWDQEVICPYIQGYYYGASKTPGMGIHSAQIYISDTGWNGFEQDPEGHYFQMSLYFPEQPEGTDYIPEGTYYLGTQVGEFVMFNGKNGGSSYFPGTQAIGGQKLFTSGRCVVTKDGDDFVIDLDVITEDGLTRHARYTGPVALSIIEY